MPRPERPLDPSAGPVPQFAAALRKLRIDAGSPPYRAMAAKAHVSKASLSAAAAGHRLPTWEVTRAYVTACDDAPQEWRERWLATRDELGCSTPAWAPGEPPAGDPPAGDPPAGDPPAGDPPAGDPPAGDPPAGRRRVPVMAAGGTVLIVAGLIGLASWHPKSPDTPVTARSPGPSSAPPPRFAGGTEPINDNADPKKTGCGSDPAAVTTLDAVQINTSNENLLGIAQLRHASACHASWGRFEPSDRLTYLPGRFTVTITAHRPATGTVGTPFTTDFDGQPVFGNILLDTAGCVEITVEVRSPYGDGTATTDCRR